MNLQNLRVFQKVAELEHITRAADELGLSQPAVTKIIQSLEQEIGLELIERRGRRIVLTHAGHILHTYSRKLAALEREMEEAMEALSTVESGEVRLGANATTGVYLLPPIVAHFRHDYPRVNLHISILNTQEVIDEILNWQIDLGLVEGDPSRQFPELKVTPFTQDHLILIVGPTHHWSQRTSVLPEQLSRGELVLREQGSGVRDVIEHELAHLGVHIHPLLILTNNEAIKQMVMNGVGAAIVSAFTVRRELAAGSLLQIPIEGLELHPQLSIIQRADKQLSRSAQAFYKYLQPQFTQTIEVTQKA